MSKSTTRQKVECLQGWMNSVIKKQPQVKKRIVHASTTSLDDALREALKK
jgi:hypothetical protein